MPPSITVSGKSLDEALFNALRQLGKRPDEITYEVLDATPGQVNIVVTPWAGDDRPAPAAQPEPAMALAVEPEGPITDETVAQTAQTVLAGLLDRMSVHGQVVVREHGSDSDGVITVTLDVLGDDLGILIGRRGETLRALQFITRLMVGKQLATWARINVDVENYKARRDETLRGLAINMAERVQSTGEPMTLEAMPPRERRIIHLTLRENPHIVTKSQGEEGDRKVVISPVHMT
ncbi:MAG: KH domain-containing protein [Chloroflexi bacterium]|nr:KH domain-containing protein [Chloroflexota bacterium]